MSGAASAQKQAFLESHFSNYRLIRTGNVQMSHSFWGAATK